MRSTDMIFSLGPNCKNTWNLRKNFQTDRAYPFDWWITPARSMLRMIETGFVFSLKQEDLHITDVSKHNTVYNSRLNLLHHHDFYRDYTSHASGIIRSVSEKDIETLNQKYTYLFNRLHEDLNASQNPVAVLNGTYLGWPTNYEGIPTNPDLNTAISNKELAEEIRSRLGKKLRIAFITVGEPKFHEYDWGFEVQANDFGYRENIDGAAYAEPIHAFKSAYQQLGFSLNSDKKSEPKTMAHDIGAKYKFSSQ